MDQKTSPDGLRLGVNYDWEAKWYADKNCADTLNEDLCIRKLISEKLTDASVSIVEIERAVNRINISIRTAKPSMVIGKGGKEVEALRKQLNVLTKKNVHINIVEIKEPDLDVKLVGEDIARQLEAKIAFRRVTRQATRGSVHSGVKDIKVQIAGHLNGADMARREWHAKGNVPLHTLGTDIDYVWIKAATTYGQIGVKAWINHGEILLQRKNKPSKKAKGGN